VAFEEDVGDGDAGHRGSDEGDEGVRGEFGDDEFHGHEDRTQRGTEAGGDAAEKPQPRRILMSRGREAEFSPDAGAKGGAHVPDGAFRAPSIRRSPPSVACSSP